MCLAFIATHNTHTHTSAHIHTYTIEKKHHVFQIRHCCRGPRHGRLGSDLHELQSSHPTYVLLALTTTSPPHPPIHTQHHTNTHTPPECPADPAVGKAGISCDFTKGACSSFTALAGKAITYGPQGAVSAVSAPRQAPTLQSNEYIFFGRVNIEMQAAPGAGVITSIVLLSDDLDEIDLEAVGSDNARIQSNTFSKGDDSKHDLLGYLPVADLTGASHKYTVDWTTDRIEFYVDGSLQRTLKRADIPDRYPQTPMRVKVGAWVAGFDGNAPGTIQWAGGVADFSNGPHSSYFKSIEVTDYAGGSSPTDKDVKEYVYGDRSGSSGSIKVVLGDGSSSTGNQGGSGSSSSSVSSSTAAPTTTSSTTVTSSPPTSSSSSTTVIVTSSTPASTASSTSSTLTTTTSYVLPTNTGSTNGTRTTTTIPTHPSVGAASGLVAGGGAALAAAAALLAAF